MRRAVNRESVLVKGSKRIEVMADKCSLLGEAGEPWAIKEIGDRLDGKPAQYSEISGKDGAPLMLVVETGVPTRAIEPPVDITPERNDINDLDDDDESGSHAELGLLGDDSDPTSDHELTDAVQDVDIIE